MAQHHPSPTKQPTARSPREDAAYFASLWDLSQKQEDQLRAAFADQRRWALEAVGTKPVVAQNIEFRSGHTAFWEVQRMKDIVSSINEAGGKLALTIGRGVFTRDYTLSGPADDMQRFRDQLIIDTLY